MAKKKRKAAKIVDPDYAPARAKAKRTVDRRYPGAAKRAKAERKEEPSKQTFHDAAVGSRTSGTLHDRDIKRIRAGDKEAWARARRRAPKKKSIAKNNGARLSKSPPK